ncbi:GyrI-like domain-containing protein [Amycolatopsis mongoliensis]|uniref:GyrI-like domain-containing protein n=1 Tax=Amycolatopsis mongoliensis TaxID=715475 RepID=A0A9Y2NE28_9PSEU|nr:GyrI-like domain-containing protein [Amycolatopsis sp. 4-36]WIX98258.1 GyrI-like domain-containing protein [Amycolatopsis sp. 4-36]
MTFPAEPEIATIGAATFLSVTGAGLPGTDEFYARKATLVAAAERLGHDGLVEGLYWFDPGHGDVGIAGFYWTVPLEHLRWRLIVRVPDDTELPADLAAPGLSLFPYAEGKVVQVTHHGPFAGEDETMARLGAFADSQGLRRNGPHHEIYFDYFDRSTSQENFRTILRDPVA